ncbi:KRAB-A domain-containing protein 2 [Orussus abietinus]|uniref:KRAB-A domain-containing protein 2 n=1 Tax=Orussus abietinus TaxID=222816 RepID=UPI0006262823|nr:KRAB-A domain-containing protein 2 [Orussus abietinus]
MDTAVNRDLFLEKLNALIAGKREDNCLYFSQEKYSKILSEVVSAKIKCNTPLDYRRLKRFDVLKIKDKENLIVPLKPGKTNIQYYVTNEELYSILYETHIRIGHGGRTRMLKELQVKYKNITYEVVMLYLNLCKQCQMKHSAPKKGIVAKPMVSSELNSRCQVDLIDLQSNRDGEYKFIMVYQDHLTKFVQLRPLKTKSAEEVARHVLSIFLTFGAPAILQSDNGREFSNRVISEICAMWKDVKIVHEKPRYSQTQGSVEKANQDIQNMLTAWMNENDTNKWSDGLSFVQFAKNTTYHEGIRQSPYEAMFGVKAKRGIASTFLPGEQIANIETEEQLEEIANTSETEEQLEETVNAYQKNLSGGHTENHIPKKNIEEDLQPTSSHQILSEKHELISIKRAAAKENLLLPATKMLRTSQKQFPPAQIGDNVRIQVPDVDRGRTDSQNVLAVVVGIEDSDFYKLANKNDEISFQEMSLREAAAANSRSGGQGYTRCQCKRKCSTNKCSCKSKGLLCNSKCHNSLSCCNK